MVYPKVVAPGDPLMAADWNDHQAATQAAQARADYAASLIPGGSTAGMPGLVLLDSFAGSSDDQKLTNAMSYAAAQTYRPGIVLGARYHTFSQPRTVYSGLRIFGPAGARIGFQNMEISGSNGQYNPCRVHLTTGTGNSSWLVGTSTTYSVTVGGIAFSGNGSSQFYHHPITAGTCYCATFFDLQFNGVKYAFGVPGDAWSNTLCAWEGEWNFTGLPDQPISVRGSDSWLQPTGMNIGWNNAPTNTYLIRFENQSKTFVKGLYLTCRNAASRAVLVQGPASSQGGLFITDSVIEGQNLNEWAAGALIMVQGGGVEFDRISCNFGMGGGTGNVLGDTADIMQTGGTMVISGVHTCKANGRSETIPWLRATGGRTYIDKVFGMQGSGQAWSQIPLAQNAGASTFITDATVRTS